MSYKEVNPQEWKYEKEGDFVEGEFLGSKSDVGPNKSMLYNLRTIEGAKSVWGSTILDSLMAHVKIGDKIKITYKGLAEQKTKGKNAAKIFKVEVDED